MKNLEQEIINKANASAESGMAMGSGFDPDSPMTTLAEAVTYFLMESGEFDEVGGEDIYDLISSKTI